MRSIRFEVEPPINRPSATGSTGWRAPERAKKSSIHATATAVSAVTTAVALANRPKAIPEFWTWWMSKGPSTCSDSSKPSCEETISFVSWSAAIAAITTAPRPAHCWVRAASERSATETGVSASVLEPTRTSYVRGAGSLTAFPSCRRPVDRSVQTDAPAEPARPETAVASDGSTSLFSALAVDALRRPGQRLETLRPDRLAAGGADPVGAALDPRERRVDRLQHPLLVALERGVELAVEGAGGHVAGLVIALDLLALVLELTLVLLLQVLERGLHPPPLLEQPLAEMLRVDRAHERLPSSRRSLSARSMPSIWTTFSRAVWPETIDSERRGRPSSCASRSSTASFARPPSGGAATRTFQPSPCRPTSSLRRAPGETRSRTRVDGFTMRPV